jgi:FkbM family methyltransferase
MSESTRWWRHWANRIRFNYGVSRILALLLRHVDRVCALVSRQIRMKVWINARQVSYDGVALVFPRDIGVAYNSGIFWDGVEGFEPRTWAVMKRLLTGTDCFVDVGSNLGLYAVLARKLRPDITVLGYEPVPAIHRKNLAFHAVNGCSATGIVNCAVGETPGTAELFLPDSSPGFEEETTGTLRAGSWQARGRSSVFTVPVTTLDLVLAGFEKGVRVLIKIDVEDFEAAVLAGGKAAIGRLQPWLICEILPRQHGNRRTLELLQELDYAAFAITRDGLFRFGSDDFSSAREFTDFLLLPATHAAGQNFLPLAALSTLFRQSCLAPQPS